MRTPSDTSPFSSDGALYAQITSAAAAAASMPEGEQKTWAHRGLASLLVGSPEAFRAAVFEQFPDLASAEPIPDTYLSAEEQEAAAQVTAADFQALDSALMSGAITSWRTVARVIGDAKVTLQGQLIQLPLGVFVRRVEFLAKSGRLEARGNIQLMRVGEVRLPATVSSAA